MRVPPFAQYQRFLAGFCLFVAGATIGSAIYMSIHQQQFSLLYVQMLKYREENKKLRDNLESLDKYRYKQSIINVVNIYLQNPEEEPPLTEDIQEEIKTAVRKDFKLVIGQKVAYARDAQPLYEKLISQKTYRIHEKNYLVGVKSMVLVQSELSVWITAKEKRT